MPPTLSTRAELEQLVAACHRSPELHARVEAVLHHLRPVLERRIVTRAHSLADINDPINRHRGLDSRHAQVLAGSEKKALTFALAMSDNETSKQLWDELPFLAAAYLLKPEPALLDRIKAQLVEVNSWTPLQRPGWTLYRPDHDLPDDGNDGVWLATGFALAALAQTLLILPHGTLPPDLLQATHDQLKREAVRIVNDWTEARVWFVRDQAVFSNQWVVPNCGLVMATAVPGVVTPPAARELGVQNLLLSMDALGSEGASSEGVHYAAGLTAPYLYQAAHAALQAGETRLHAHPYLRNFPRWLAHMFQPGGFLVNCFDCRPAARGDHAVFAPWVAACAVLSGSPELGWTRRQHFDPPPPTLHGLLSLLRPDHDLAPPPRWTHYRRGELLVWRDGWTNDASGFWIRGGDPQDFHDHWDRGHINFIVNGHPVLIEAGTPAYGNPAFLPHYKSVRGHNVLQVDDETLPHRSPAPLQVIRVDETGGEVIVEAGHGYARVNHWHRRVVWTGKTLLVTDQIILTAPSMVYLRWHLGTSDSAHIAPTSGLKIVAHLPPRPSAPAIALAFDADHPLLVSQEQSPDHTLDIDNENHRHTVILSQSTDPVTTLTVTTTVTVN